MLKLYGCGSPNVRKITIMLAELGLDYERAYVDVFNEGQFAPQFLALNPLGRVPVLVDTKGTVEPIFESGAILIHLAETYEDGEELLPAAGAARYGVLKWLMLQIANIGPTLGQLNHFLITPDHAASYAGGRYREQSHRLYHLLDAELATRAWLAGDRFSIADIATYPWILYAGRHGIDLQALPSLAAWMAAMEARPGVQEGNRAIGWFIQNDVAHQATASQHSYDKLFWRERPGPGTDLSPMMTDEIAQYI